MSTLDQIFTLIGLSFNFWGTCILIKPLFLTDDEIDQLSELPIVEASMNLTGKVSGKNVQVAGIEKDSFEKFKKTVVTERTNARKKGKNGLYFIMIGFSIQALSVLIDVFL